MSATQDALERVVKNLSNHRRWNWAYVCSHRDAADGLLKVLSDEGLIECVNHPLGGSVWRVNGKLFGRTDGITSKRFSKLVREQSKQ
jgi:hypothetical protein